MKLPIARASVSTVNIKTLLKNCITTSSVKSCLTIGTDSPFVGSSTEWTLLDEMLGLLAVKTVMLYVPLSLCTVYCSMVIMGVGHRSLSV